MTHPTAYPLHWPAGWPRTPAHLHQNSMNRWGRTEGGRQRPWRFSEAVATLADELERLGATDAIVSSNFQLTKAGVPSQNFGRPADQGVAVYFTLHGRQMAMAQDAHTRAEENVRSLALALKYMRGLEENGGGVMMEKAFAGFAALPAPGETVTQARPWREVLGVAPDCTSYGQALVAFKLKRKECHPDAPTGSHDKWLELSDAWEAARRELGE